MSQLRFQHVFFTLMLLALVSAFVMPARTDRLKSLVQGLVLPVSAPTRALAGWIRGPERTIDEGAKPGERRSDGDLVEENAQLRISVAHLTQQLDDLKQLNADRELLGDLRSLCTPVMVSGADPGKAQALNLQSGSGDGIRDGMAVLYPGGVAGRIDRAGVSGSTVRLLTDTSVRVMVRFARFEKRADGRVEFIPIAATDRVARGDGTGGLFIPSLQLREIEDAQLKVDDWVVLHDNEWPPNVQGYRIGRIREIAASPDGPLFRELKIEPARKLSALREVMVLTKEGLR